MSAKKTLSSWLTNKYLLIIRNEENFAEKSTFSFNYARLLLIIAGIGLLLLGLAVWLVTIALHQWLDPRSVEREANRQVIELSLRLDSLEKDIHAKDVYIQNIQAILGNNINTSVPERDEVEVADPAKLEEIKPFDAQFRADIEQSDLISTTGFASSKDKDGLENLFLFRPVDGTIIDGYDPKKDHFGIDIVSTETEPVLAVADGVVILSSWTLDGGYVIAIQHNVNLISIYKHNSELFKNVGSFVNSGEVIATIGNTGELTSGPHLHLELWYDGSPFNPLELIAF